MPLSGGPPTASGSSALPSNSTTGREGRSKKRDKPQQLGRASAWGGGTPKRNNLECPRRNLIPRFTWMARTQGRRSARSRKRIILPQRRSP